MVRPPKKRACNFEDKPERQVEPSQDATDQETLQPADSNAEYVIIKKESSTEVEEEEEEGAMNADSSLLEESVVGGSGSESQTVTPTKSRFGRSHKPKVLGDFVSTDKKVSIVLKVSPVNQFKYYKDSSRNPNKPKHERRGRPRKSLLRDSFDAQKTESSPKSQKEADPVASAVDEAAAAAAVSDEVDVKVDPAEMQVDPSCQWQVGDLAWARIGNHPFWPCIIARDPELAIFTRIKMFTKSLVPHRRLHVQFFGDNGRRSWLSSTSVMNYTGRAAFEELSQSILSAVSRLVSCVISRNQVADVLSNLINFHFIFYREERVLHFKRLVQRNARLAERKGAANQSPSSPKVKRQYRKRKAEQSQEDSDYVVAEKQIKLDNEAVESQSSTPPVSTPPVLTPPVSTPPVSTPSVSTPPVSTPSASTPRKRGRPRKSLTPSTVIKTEPIQESTPSSRPVRQCTKIVIKMEVDESKNDSIPDSKQVPSTSSGGQAKKKFRSPTVPAPTLPPSSDQPSKAKNKKTKLGAEFNKFSSKQFNKVSSQNPDMGTKEIEIHLERMWKELHDSQKSKCRIKVNCKDKEDDEEEESVTWDPEDTDEKTSTSEMSESPLTQPPPKARTKVSIFNGAFQGKVCQVCEKPGNTFRCKGPCYGTYHLECAANPRDFSARINEIFQSVNAASSPALQSRKKKVDSRGRRKSIVSTPTNDDDATNKSVTTESEDLEESSTTEENVDDSKKSLVLNESEDVKETTGSEDKIDKRRNKSLLNTESEDLEETGLNEEKKKKIDERRKSRTESVDSEMKEDSSKEVKGKRNLREESVDSEVEGDSVNEVKEKIDGKRKLRADSKDSEVKEDSANEVKGKIDGRRKSRTESVDSEVKEDTANKVKGKIDGRRKSRTESVDSEMKEDSSKEVNGKIKLKEESVDLEVKEDSANEMKGSIDGKRKLRSKSVDSEVKEDTANEVKGKIDGRRRRSIVKKETENSEDATTTVKKEDEYSEQSAGGSRKAVNKLVKAESEDSEDLNDRKKEDEGAVDKKKKKGAAKESSDSSEEADSQSADFRCAACTEGRLQPCFVCGRDEINGHSSRQRCHVAQCGRVYHLECLKAWPQVNWLRSGGGGGGSGRRGGEDRGDMPPFACPQHACHTCISDNPSVMKERFANDRLVKCLRCPTSYHYGNHCLPAGTEIIAARQIICPQHYKKHKKGLQHVNAAWCFICASGGSLICCDMCPTSFHADCLKISPPEGGYICEDCETGRFPLYGEIVWVKLGIYRWWPAQVMFPHLIPPNIRNLAHARGEFAVKFFGSHDFYWVNRGRVFLYQEGDSGGRCTSKRKATDQMFLRAVEEATEAYTRIKNEKASREATHRSGMKPPSYIRIKTNKPVGQVRAMEANISSLTPCECDPNSANPCGLDTDCLNRILMIECNPLICPAGERCKNQQFEKREYPPLMPYRTDGRGWGLKTLVDLKKGEFVIEYVGEMINELEYQRRLQKMHEANENNYYFLTIDKDRMLDAGPKGNVARFMNHSCQPNCETQKWTVNGDTRVGLFALHDISAETELVFNYNLESIGTEKKQCMCGAPNCSGFIGVKASKNGNGISAEDSVLEKLKKPRRRSRSSKQPAKLSDDFCFICQEGGELLLCDGKHCTKAYHLNCLSRNKKHPAGYWLCPWHQCNVCCKGKVFRCNFCINSYCPTHAEGNIRLEESIGYVCTKHGCTKSDKNKADDRLKLMISAEVKPKPEKSSPLSDVKVPVVADAPSVEPPSSDVKVPDVSDAPPVEPPSSDVKVPDGADAPSVEPPSSDVKMPDVADAPVELPSSDVKMPDVADASPVELPSSDEKVPDVADAPSNEPPSSKSSASSEEKQNNNVESVKSVWSSPRTRRARSNSDVNQAAASANITECSVKLLRYIRRPASVDSLKETEVPLKETLLRTAVLKRRRSLKTTSQEEEQVKRAVVDSESCETSKENTEPKVMDNHGNGETLNEFDVSDSNNMNGVGNAQVNGHVENEENDLSGSIPANREQKNEESEEVTESTTSEVNEIEKVTSNQDEDVVAKDVVEGKNVVSEINGDKNGMDLLDNDGNNEESKSNSQEKHLPVDESKFEDSKMECESVSSAEKKIDNDKTDATEKSEVMSNSFGCDLDMEVTHETADDDDDDDVCSGGEQQVPTNESCNEKSTKDESCSEEAKNDGANEESLHKQTEENPEQVKVNGVAHECTDERMEVNEDDKTNYMNSSDNETSGKTVDNSKISLETVAETNGDAEMSESKDECVLKKSADSKKLILTEDQDSLVA
ncbi:histone-lysine N-methyltransferase NSD2 [Nilaparvata lugens]|uniref:histone-lysine N-methyltransferase NSD2 n=1 Tax=Nilaparvata lugens TaxID=108931 RepID=UPI00193E418E|nr:histone-lysine N-methyltransferase NSD2 [Nilaparvata lugens]